MLIVELSIYPLGARESTHNEVAQVIDIIDKSGLDYRLGPMGTCIEGDWDEVMGVVKQCFQTLSEDHARIEFSIQGDWRKGNEPRLNKKVESIQHTLNRNLKT
jgi:uncharacterized protein (TIGR00106 family)